MVPCSTASASEPEFVVTRKRVRVMNSRTTASVNAVSVPLESVRVANTGTASVFTPGGRCVAAPSV